MNLIDMPEPTGEGEFEEIFAAVGRNWKTLCDFLGDNLTEQRDEHLNLLDDLRDNRRIAVGEKEFYALGMRDAPAAVKLHHARFGGFVQHVMEMLRAAAKYKAMLQDDLGLRDPCGYYNDEFIIRHVLYHDLSKTYMLYGINKVNYDKGAFKVERLRHATDQLLGSDVKSLWLLNQYGIKLDPLQMHCLLNAEGGYADIKTPWTASISKFLHHLDEISAGLLERDADGTELGILTDSSRGWESAFGKNQLFGNIGRDDSVTAETEML